jgi:hypothetical protein
MSDYRRGFGFYIAFIDHYNTQLIITLHYSASADLYALHITVTHAQVFSVCY